MRAMGDSGYQYTNGWFDGARGVWDEIIPQINPTTILEIGNAKKKLAPIKNNLKLTGTMLSLKWTF